MANEKSPLLKEYIIKIPADKQEIIDGVYLGLGINIASPYKPGTRWSNPNLKPYAYMCQKPRRC